MKARNAILVILLSVILIQTALAYETVKVTDLTADVSFEKDYGGAAAGNNVTINLELPFTLESLNNTNNNITITADAATASTTINLTVNGIVVASNYAITGGDSATWTFVDFANAGVDMNATNLTIVVDVVANNTTSTVLKLNGDDVPLKDNYTVTYTEYFIGKPVVKDRKSLSFFTVKDRIKVTQNSDVNLTDVKFNITYPEQTITKTVTSYNMGILNKSEVKTLDVSYQKWGPFVSDFKKYVDGNNVTVSILIFSYEDLTASFTFNPYEKPYSDYFERFSKDNIKEIKLNGVKVNWTDPSDNIIIETMELNEGINTLNVTYVRAPEIVATTTMTPIVITPQPTILTQTFLGIPVYVWIAIILAIAVYAVLKRS